MKSLGVIFLGIDPKIQNTLFVSSPPLSLFVPLPLSLDSHPPSLLFFLSLYLFPSPTLPVPSSSFSSSSSPILYFLKHNTQVHIM